MVGKKSFGSQKDGNIRVFSTTHPLPETNPVIPAQSETCSIQCHHKTQPQACTSATSSCDHKLPVHLTTRKIPMATVPGRFPQPQASSLPWRQSAPVDTGFYPVSVASLAPIERASTPAPKAAGSRSAPVPGYCQWSQTSGWI